MSSSLHTPMPAITRSKKTKTPARTSVTPASERADVRGRRGSDADHRRRDAGRAQALRRHGRRRRVPARPSPRAPRACDSCRSRPACVITPRSTAPSPSAPRDVEQPRLVRLTPARWPSESISMSAGMTAARAATRRRARDLDAVEDHGEIAPRSRSAATCAELARHDAHRVEDVGEPCATNCSASLSVDTVIGDDAESTSAARPRGSCRSSRAAGSRRRVRRGASACAGCCAACAADPAPARG